MTMMTRLSLMVAMMVIVASLTPFCNCFLSSSSPPSLFLSRQCVATSREQLRQHERIFWPLHLSSYGSSSNNNKDNRNEPQDFPLDWTQDSRINVRNLLTQRSVQSFLYLCESLRDPHSGKWIQDFFDCPNQLEYHGTGANYVTCQKQQQQQTQTQTTVPLGQTSRKRYVGDGTWDGPLLAMLEQPKDVVIVSAKRRGAGHGGWSKDNPYLQDRYVEFEIDVDPVSLASRILAVREQLSKEWFFDLDVLKEANDQILTSYFERAKIERTKRDSELTESPSVAFDRMAVNLMNNQTIFAVGSSSSSPFRKGNFDLLYNLCTQASIHRLLRELKNGGEAQEVPFEWLREFYVDRVEEYFDGDQAYGRADDFIEELLLSSPSIIHRDDGKIALADPFYLAEKVIETRNTIVSEWKEVMGQVPAEHQDGIRRIVLEKQIAAWGSGGGGGTGGETPSSSTTPTGPSFQ